MSRTVPGAIAVTVAAWALVSRYLPVTGHLTLITAALSPYLLGCGALAALLLWTARRRAAALLAAALTVAAVAVQAPQFRPDPLRHADGIAVRVLTANLHEGRAEAAALVHAAAGADVVALQELTPDAVDRLAAAGLDTAFPHRLVEARAGGAGVGLWSRFPLQDTTAIDGYTMPVLGARLRLPGADPHLLVVHLPGPWPQPVDDWRRDIARLPATLRALGAGPVLVAGDFNATVDIRDFRALLRDGYRDAAGQAGAGPAPTFPADRRLPPLLGIDHVLTRDATATALHTVGIPGSDHRGLIATVRIPTSR